MHVETGSSSAHPKPSLAAPDSPWLSGSPGALGSLVAWTTREAGLRGRRGSPGSGRLLPISCQPPGRTGLGSGRHGERSVTFPVWGSLCSLELGDTLRTAEGKTKQSTQEGSPGRERPGRQRAVRSRALCFPRGPCCSSSSRRAVAEPPRTAVSLHGAPGNTEGVDNSSLWGAGPAVWKRRCEQTKCKQAAPGGEGVSWPLSTPRACSPSSPGSQV